MNPTNALQALATLLEYAFVGRVLLSILPPGLPGSHSPRDLPATWAASHLLGTVALGLELRLFDRFHPDPRSLLLLAPWLLLALARWLTLPGAMVPRHEPSHESQSRLATLLLLLSALSVIVSPLLRAEPAGSSSSAVATLGHTGSPIDPGLSLCVADSLALLALVSFGLSAARRAPLGRALAVLLLAVVLSAALSRSLTLPIPLALTLGGGSALAVPWLRRGDRRAGAFAVLALSGSALLGPRAAIFAAVGLAALWIHTSRPSRPNLAVFSAAAFAVFAIAGFPTEREHLHLASFLPPLTAATLVVVGFALFSRRNRIASRGTETSEPARPGDSIDSPRPQAALLRDVVLLCIVAMASRNEIASLDVLFSALVPLSPLFAIEAGLLLARAEVPGAAGVAPPVAADAARR